MSTRSLVAISCNNESILAVKKKAEMSTEQSAPQYYDYYYPLSTE